MTTGERHINYEALAQDAIRGIVRAVLGRVAKFGLPGGHHFYIAFDTRAAGTLISKRLKEKYPEEMTIVLQHRFWNLVVSDTAFEVTLTFDGIEERLVVPFAAVKVFFDPSVPYGLQFEGAATITDTMDELASEPVTRPRVPRPRKTQAAVEILPASTQKKPRGPRKPRSAKSPGAATDADPRPQPVAARPKLVASKTGQPDQPANDTKVIQLDKFRKK
jgi:hypothetical protein